MKNHITNEDLGYSSLMDRVKILKSDSRFDLLGTLDELNSHMGLIRSKIIEIEQNEFIKNLQRKIMIISAYIADNRNDIYLINDNDVILLNKKTDELRALYPKINSLTIPGDSEYSAQIDIARTVARRTERVLSKVHEDYPVSDIVLRFMNKFSDYLFVLARYIEYKTGIRIREENK